MLRSWMKWPLLVALLGCGACGDSETPDPTDPTNPGGSAERTLENCQTNIAQDAPDFFKNYFRCVNVTMSGSSVVITTQSLPPHRSAYYGTSHPNYAPFDTSRGPQYKQNPNTIATLNVRLTIPMQPTPKGLTISPAMIDGVVGTSTHEYSLGAVGVALDSVALFNPLAAPGDSIEQEQYTFDSYNAHPTQRGEYHYHTTSPGPLEVLKAKGLVTTSQPGAAELEVLGIFCDGTVVLGCTELNGATPQSADFDKQNGHVHDLVDKAGTVMMADRYHTHVCPSRYTYKYTPEIQYYSSCVNR
ncbi:MAG TPA: YHYH protein [Myxococcaceae bacterium]|nr:YHYH protein [Myxococcaceae bacterium]